MSLTHADAHDPAPSTGTSVPPPATPFPPDRTDGQAKLRAVHQRLAEAIAELTCAENWQLMLRTAAKLPTYSPHNVLLITSQFPEASAVAGFHTWRQLGRSVRKGEKGIAILAPVLRRAAAPGHDGRQAGTDLTARPASTAGEFAGGTAGADVSSSNGSGPPNAEAAAGTTTAGGRRVSGFRVVHVFDISQTDGPDLPRPPQPQLLEGQAPAGLLDGLTEQVLQQGYQLIRHDFDIPHPGVGVPNGVTDYLARSVIVRPDLSEAQTVKTLAHELGHVLLHEPARRPAGLDRRQAEVEAESVAHIVAAAHGLDTTGYTIPYIAGWSEGNLELLAASAERVVSTAHRILTATPPPPTFVLTDPTGRQQARRVTRQPDTSTVEQQQRGQARPDRDRRLDAPRPAVTAPEATGPNHAQGGRTAAVGGSDAGCEQDRPPATPRSPSRDTGQRIEGRSGGRDRGQGGLW